MNAQRPVLRFLLDEGVPDSVASMLRECGHEAALLRGSGIERGTVDTVICAFAEASGLILVALDADMKQLVQSGAIATSRFRRLSLLKLSCREMNAASRVQNAISLIEHEWLLEMPVRPRRFFIEIATNVIRVFR